MTTRAPDIGFEPPVATSRTMEAYAIVEKWRKAKGYTHTGGCRLYYSGEEWAERGEQFGKGAILILVHDGGDLSNYNGPTEPLRDEGLRLALYAADMWIESCTGWYDAIYDDKE